MSARGKRPEQPTPEALARYCGPRCRGGSRCGGCVEKARRDRRAAEEAEAAVARVERASVQPLEAEACALERVLAERVEATDARRLDWSMRLAVVRRYLGWAS